MISASDLDKLLETLKKHSVNVLRYKQGSGDTGEEIEIVIPTGTVSSDELEDVTDTKAGPKIRLIGFQSDGDEDND